MAKYFRELPWQHTANSSWEHFPSFSHRAAVNLRFNIVDWGFSRTELMRWCIRSCTDSYLLTLHNDTIAHINTANTWQTAPPCPPRILPELLLSSSKFKLLHHQKLRRMCFRFVLDQNRFGAIDRLHRALHIGYKHIGGGGTWLL